MHNIEQGTLADLDAVNSVIGQAIGTWTVSDRVKRLSLPVYQYDAVDLSHLHLAVIRDNSRELIALATWEAADKADLPPGKTGLLLHGLYVMPSAFQRGYGSALLQACLTAAEQAGFDGVLVKATRDSESFFAARGMTQLPVNDRQRDYDRRYWLATPTKAPQTRPG